MTALPETQGPGVSRRKAKRVMLVAGVVALSCALIVLAVLLSWSTGRVGALEDEQGRPVAGSISEKIRVLINGVEQGMFIRGKDATKPVLLFLHGGPGMPEYFLDRVYPTGLEEDFVVCWWEQRGAGLSYHPDIPPESMTVEQLISDTVAVTDYLRERFGEEKIYLLGHSWGSFLGIQVAARAPERYHAYIGMGQVSHQFTSETMAYEYELERFRDLGDVKMVRKLEEAPIGATGPIPGAYMKLRDKAMHSLGVGTTREMGSVVTGIFVPVWQTPAYTIKEKIDIGRGKSFSHELLWDDFVNTDLTVAVPELQVPAYFCHGVYDYTVSYALAKTYFGELVAPSKGFYTFERSAHSPAFEEPERMRQIMREDVLKGRTTLADEV